MTENNDVEVVPTPPGEAGQPRASWRSSLTGRAILLMMGVIALVGTSAYLWFSPRVEQTFEEEISKRGNAMVSILEWHTNVRLALSLKDNKIASEVTAQVMNGDPGTRYIVLLDSDNKPLGGLWSGSDTKDSAPTLPTAQQLESIRANLTPGESLDGDIHRFVHVVSPSDRDAKGSELDFTNVGNGEKKELGKIVLGLSAVRARHSMSVLTVELIVSLGVVLLGVFYWFFRGVGNRLGRMVKFAEEMAAGNLTEHISDDGRDEIGRMSETLQELRNRMGSMVVRLQDAAGALTQASGEILSSTSQQGQAASRQAASVTETGATMAELKEIFAQAAERAQSVIDLAKKSEDSTTSGRAAVQESVQAMEQIRDEVTHISSTILGLVERTNQIAVIIDTVNDLAEQSNVLALNAAIEAARAGEHGKGFAVVAREVRNLAKRSKDSTSQVRTILQDIEKASRDAISVIDEGTRKTQSGMELANRAGESIVLLDQAIDASSTAAKQIAASIRQQSAGMEQIWQAMRDVDRTVQQSVTGIQQLESSSKNMKELSEQMRLLTSAYKVVRNGVGALQTTPRNGAN